MSTILWVFDFDTINPTYHALHFGDLLRELENYPKRVVSNLNRGLQLKEMRRYGWLALVDVEHSVFGGESESLQECFQRFSRQEELRALVYVSGNLEGMSILRCAPIKGRRVCIGFCEEGKGAEFRKKCGPHDTNLIVPDFHPKSRNDMYRLVGA